MKQPLRLETIPYTTELATQHNKRLFDLNPVSKEPLVEKAVADMLSELYVQLEKKGHFNKIESLVNRVVLENIMLNGKQADENNIRAGKSYFGNGELYSNITNYIYSYLINENGIEDLGLSDKSRDKMLELEKEDFGASLLYFAIHDFTLISFNLVGNINVFYKDIKKEKKCCL